MNHEYEQNRASSSASAITAHSYAAEPGQSSRSAALRKPEHVIASGLVQRKGCTACRNDKLALTEQLPDHDVNGESERHIVQQLFHKVSHREPGQEVAPMSTGELAAIQMKAHDEPSENDVHSLATEGISGSATSLPFLEQIQRSFGPHDVSDIQAHIGGPANHACHGMGAMAYATGNHVAFRQAPDLHTAAHEATHVVQQRAGVQLTGGVGQEGDEYERNADQVADAVVAGRSAEALLSRTGQRKRFGGQSEVGERSSTFQALQKPACPKCGRGACECSKPPEAPGRAGDRMMNSEVISARISPVAVAHVQRFESYEHVQLGDTAGGANSGNIRLQCHSRDLPQHADRVATWPITWKRYHDGLNGQQRRALTRGLTYGEIAALSGDMYTDFQALDRAPLREVIDLIPLIRSATATTEQFQAATGGRYLTLARANIGHFSNVPDGRRNRDIWRHNHIGAIAAARAGNQNLAWGLNAAGDHFLTDAFSGGHLRVPRAALHAQGADGDIESKIIHDLENQFGVEVTNDRGDRPWIAFGDNHLNDPANARSLSLALEAVQLSRQDIADALARGTSYPEPAPATRFAAEALLPRPVVGAGVRWGATDYSSETARLVASEAPGIASGLTGDDNRVRDWINRMEPTALGRQGERDVTRMLNVLLSGTMSEDDMLAIERLLGSLTDATVMSHLYAVFEPRAYRIGGFNDFGFRGRFRVALSRRP